MPRRETRELLNDMDTQAASSAELGMRSEHPDAQCVVAAFFHMPRFNASGTSSTRRSCKAGCSLRFSKRFRSTAAP